MAKMTLVKNYEISIIFVFVEWAKIRIFGGILGPIWGHLGLPKTDVSRYLYFWAPFGESWGPFGAIWGFPFGLIWRHLGPFGAIWAHISSLSMRFLDAFGEIRHFY